MPGPLRKGIGSTVSTREITALYRRLPEDKRRLLLEFAEFLAARGATETVLPLRKVDIARPEAESVVAAMKRLTASYPMLDKATLLDAAASLMSAHVLEGRPATDVIDQLERLFRERYEAYCASCQEPQNEERGNRADTS